MTRFKAALGILALTSAVAVLVAVVLPTRSTAAQAQSATPTQTLTAQGHGEVNVQPNQASISLGVESRAKDAKAALADNTAKMNAVIDAIKAQGVDGKNIQTNNLSMYFDSQQSTYVASHQVMVKVGDIDKVGALLDASVAAGANTSWGVNFGLSDASAAHSQALAAAIANARQRADDMARALGVKVTGVVSAEEASAAMPFAGKGSAAGAGMAVQPGELTVSADVNVTYTFGT